MDSVFPVYHTTEWLSDRWDPKSYGRDFDFSRPFFAQFKELSDMVPHPATFTYPDLDVNSEYTNCSSGAKNCYMITQAEWNEDCFYSRGINTSKNCCDCLRILGCELCYECVSSRNCYRCFYCEDMDNSSDCWFSTDLRGCKYCFGCHGLAQKEYHIFNKPVSKEQWKEQVEKLVLSHTIVTEMKRRSTEVRLTIPQRANHMTQCEDCTGDDLLQCRNTKYSFDSRELEDCQYCNELPGSSKDCMDLSMFGMETELTYECCGCGYRMYNTLFSFHCWNNIQNLIYCDTCYPSVKDCFGCFGLRNAQYCILNKQYTKEEYEALVPKIIEHMRKTGEWGQFFNQTLSAHGYNETLAQDFFPLTKEEVLKHGWRWHDETTSTEHYMGPEVAVPETINEVADDITEKILRCADTQKPYRITKQELDLYRRLGIPVPRLSQQARHTKRMAARRPRRLWDRSCMKCKKPISTTYAPDRPEIVYCESCYLQSVY